MINPNVKWQKYLNGSNRAINKYLSYYGNPIIEQTFKRLTNSIYNDILNKTIRF